MSDQSVKQRRTQANRRVAIVNASEGQREEINKILKHFCDVSLYDGDANILQTLIKLDPAVVILDQTLASGNGLDLIGRINATTELKNTAIIYCVNKKEEVLVVEAIKSGADDFVVRPFWRNVLVNKVAHFLSAQVERGWEKLPELQRAALKDSVKVFGKISDALLKGGALPYSMVEDSCKPLVDSIKKNDFSAILDGVRDHDDYTYAHSMRVASMLALLGNAAGFGEDEQLLMATGGLLHDVGKMKVPHHILNKPGKLTDEEFEVIKSHVPHTMEYLDGIKNLPKAIRVIAEQHHEKIDGTGYPNGLKGKQLNELARMSAVVDVYSALTDRRVYKWEMPAEKAISIMKEDMKEHLDQHFVKMFAHILHDADLLE